MINYRYIIHFSSNFAQKEKQHTQCRTYASERSNFDRIKAQVCSVYSRDEFRYDARVASLCQWGVEDRS